MLRRAIRYLSNEPRVADFVRRNRLAKRFASRFVAGETIDDAMRCRVRFCKGAYRQSPSVAFASKRDVDTKYVTCVERPANVMFILGNVARETLRGRRGRRLAASHSRNR